MARGRRTLADAATRILLWCALGVALLGSAAAGLAQPDRGLPTPAVAVLWLACMTLAVLSTLPLPGWGTALRLGPALDYAAVLVLGGANACGLGIVARMLAGATGRWRTPALRGVVHGAVVLAAAGVAYRFAGGASGAAFGVDAKQAPALVAGGVAYLAAARALAWAAVRRHRRAAPVWRHWRRDLTGEALVLGLAAPLALAQVRLGMGATVLLLLLLSLAWHLHRVWHEAKRRHLEGVRTLMTALDFGDPFTRGLSYRVAKMCLRVGQHLGLSSDELEELEYAALFHDIGRTAIQHDILVKPGELTGPEVSALRQHPKIGADIVRRIGFLPGAAAIVHAHHEQPDGKGYPRRLAGPSIPLGSRIIMVVAAFDAMTSDRPYRRGLAPEAAAAELRAHAGTQFFPEVVEALIELYSNGSLLDEFDSDVLEQYARGEGNSRAIAAQVEKRGGPAQASGERDLDARAPADGVPVLELPAGDPEVLRREFRLADDGSRMLRVAAMSDVGCVRRNNEDAFGAFDLGARGCVLVVADGMGGAAAGELASSLAVETLRGALRGGPVDASDVFGALGDALQRANTVIHARASQEHELRGMGTTCTVACIVGRELVIGHVGDSRAYLVAPGGIRQLTRDHNLAEEFRAVGGPAVAKAARNVLTRALGSQAVVEADLCPSIPLQAGNTLVLCSDGLSALLSAEEIAHCVLEHDPEEACRKLLHLARERGGPDNITAIVARVDEPRAGPRR